MLTIISKAVCYVVIIIGAYWCKSKNKVPKNSSQIFSMIMLNFTLPCAIIMNFNNQVIPITMLFLIGLGILYNLISLFIGYIIGNMNERNIMTMINVSGYNIGCFAMPFVSGFFTADAVLVTSLFDIGNSIMCLGFNYTIASLIQMKDKQTNVIEIGKRILSSVPIWTYFVMLTMSFLSLKIPDFLLPLFETVGKANSFVAMCVIGLSIHITYKKDYLKHIMQIVSLRFIISVLLAIITYLFVYPIYLRNVIIILCFAPIGAASIIFTNWLGLDSEESACINSFYVIISIVMMSIIIVTSSIGNI